MVNSTILWFNYQNNFNKHTCFLRSELFCCYCPSISEPVYLSLLVKAKIKSLHKGDFQERVNQWIVAPNLPHLYYAIDFIDSLLIEANSKKNTTVSRFPIWYVVLILLYCGIEI